MAVTEVGHGTARHLPQITIRPHLGYRHIRWRVVGKRTVDVAAQRRGKTIPFFGWQLPPLVDAERMLSRSVRGIHETIGVVGYFLIGLQAATALFHHYFVRDETLLRMSPHRHTP